MKTKFFSLFVALFATTALWAYDFQYGDLYYNITSESDQTVEVTCQKWYSSDNYNGLTTATIPTTVSYYGTTYSVTSIGGNAFDGCTGLTSVIIPNGVTSIGWGAFKGCTGLTSITIPNSVTGIGDDAFYGCIGLTSITLLNSIIGNGTFAGCTSLTSITIPNSVTSIGEYAFSGCTGLTSVTIPNSVTSIKEGTFIGCTGLTSITIPNSITSIEGVDWGAFYGCTGLTSVTIPNSVTSIGYSAFSGCTGLTSVVVESGNTVFDSRDNCNAIIETATNTLKYGCPATIIPNSVTSIGEHALEDCTNLTSVTIPNSVTSIGECAFCGCTGLTSITIPNSVTTIGSGAFASCTGLTSVTIGNSVTEIGDEAFSGCTGLTSITIPNSVTEIGDEAFSGCTGLTSITIPNSVTAIGDEAFSGCTSLTSITLLNSIIGNGTFAGCTSLTSVIIPNSVTSIEDYAFYGCTGLTSVVIGNNNELNIEANAFSYCENLTSVTCYANVPPIIIFDEYEGEKDGAFDAERLSKMRLYVPAKAISQYKEAEEWKDFGRIAPIGATTVDTDDEQPIIEPSTAEVTITWKITPNAETYTIVITRGTETVCTLVFNADGQLTNIAFAAPSRNGTPRHAPAAVMTKQGYQFTVTGLESGTQYGYTLSEKDGNGKELHTYTGAFTTQGESTAIDNLSADNNTTQPKVIRNGQLLIQKGGKTYTLTGVGVK